jgi:CelD/BcsL family acetyltransferase involved in cellulose biosynthesis
MQATIYTEADKFELLTDDWADLLRRSRSAPFFMHPLYQTIWWRHLGNDDLRLITIRSDQGRLLGLAPLYLKMLPGGERQLTFVGCVDVSDYLDVLVDGEHVEAVHQTLLDALADEDLVWDKLYLCSLPHNSLTPSRLAEAARQRGWQVEVKQQDVCPVITLPQSWDEYLAGLNKKQRHEVRRKMRRVETEAVTRWRVVESAGEVESAMELFVQLHQKSTRAKEDFWSNSLISFFKSVTRALAAVGWLKLYFVEINGVPAAAMLAFDYSNEFLLYNSGYDPDQFAHLSPGNVLTAYTIRHAIELGRKRYDFLRGDEDYKFRFGGRPEPVYDVEMWRK